MDRRTVLASFASALVAAACGGGGGGAGGAETVGAASAHPPAPTSAANTPSAFVAAPSNIALWGDSHVSGLPGNADIPGVAAALRSLVSGRTVFDGGIAGETSSQIAARQSQDTAHDDWVSVFWYGGNNQTQAEAIKDDLARSIASLASGHQRFVVLPVLNQAGEERGSPNHRTISRLNAELAALYPRNFVDVRSELLARADAANAADRADVDQDVVPSSLRADGVHLNQAGALVVAQQLLAFITAQGW